MNRSLLKNWWNELIRGIPGVLFGMIYIFYPFTGKTAIFILPGVFFIGGAFPTSAWHSFSMIPVKNGADH